MFRRLIQKAVRKIIRMDPFGLSSIQLSLNLQRVVEMVDGINITKELREDVQEKIDDGDLRYERHAEFLDGVLARMERSRQRYDEAARELLQVLLGDALMVTGIETEEIPEDAQLTEEEIDARIDAAFDKYEDGDLDDETAAAQGDGSDEENPADEDEQEYDDGADIPAAAVSATNGASATST